MKKTKQYKAVSPENTINKIRSILNNVGIFLKESSYEKDGLYACRLTINNNGLSVLNIGTNGKGRSYEYALASGYAEFMERLQNGIVYNQSQLDLMVKYILGTHDDTSSIKKEILENKLSGDFIFDVNEKVADTNTIIKTFYRDLKQLFHIEDDKNAISKIMELLKDDKVIMAPVYSVTEGREILYPMMWSLMATGSNGMCAGNNSSEAILQGMCEIFERYAASQIFFNHLTPPTLKIEDFNNTVVYDKMKSLKKRYGYDFIIKDCSLGKGLPVVGLLVINHNNNTYNFKLGADFVPAIALERCLTELYQSNHGFIGLPLLNKDSSNDNERYCNMLQNGTGNWPDSIFHETPSYQFSGFNELLGQDNSVDLQYGCNLIRDLGSNLYIRDNSYLGFPAYYVIAPGLSGICIDIEELINDKNADPVYIMSNHKGKFDIDKDLNNLITDVELSLRRKGKFNFNDLIPFYRSKELNDLDPYLFLCMAYYKSGNFQKAYNNICIFLHNKGQEYKYYFAVSEYILLRYINHIKDEDVKSTLFIKYGKELANEVIEDMFFPNEIFKYYNFKSHFDWENMNTNRNSHFMSILTLDRKLKRIISNNPIKQGELEKVFK